MPEWTKAFMPSCKVIYADSTVCDVRRGRRVSVPIMYTLMSTLLELNYNILFKVIDLYLGDKKMGKF